MRRQNTKGLDGEVKRPRVARDTAGVAETFDGESTRTAAFPCSSSLLSVSAGIFRIIFTVLLSLGTGERKNESETDGGRSTRARLSDCRETERWQDA